jgi:hypothetical protein
VRQSSISSDIGNEFPSRAPFLNDSATGRVLVNQRVFFQWIGQHNTFDEPVPCYATGTQRLYRGEALIALSTDGVFESIPAFYDQPEQLLYVLASTEQLADGVGRALDLVHDAHGGDSATLVAWRVRGG